MIHAVQLPGTNSQWSRSEPWPDSPRPTLSKLVLIASRFPRGADDLEVRRNRAKTLPWGFSSNEFSSVMVIFLSRGEPFSAAVVIPLTDC